MRHRPYRPYRASKGALSFFAFFVLVLFAGLQAACGGGGDGHPPAASARSEVPGTLRQALPDEVAPCEPGAMRECTWRFVDTEGQEQCWGSYQFCRDDGDGWLECGAPAPAGGAAGADGDE